ncbi:MAG TPA: preprotein translocase subunit SecE [Gaiellaceae bacterium]|nr:preprotein translocase subunit SecE [Gaiellaceae bacterium]
MARPSRQQRRERRAQQPALAGAGTPPTLPTPRAARGSDEPERRRPQQATEAQRRGGGPIRFVQEAYGELKKVEWPDQKAVISGTVVVLIACVIVGFYLWLNDELWRYVVQHVLLR